MTDHERIFDALPPARGRGFARTWWGKRWLAALEDTALDAEQLRQGRRYARRGAVGAVSVRPGRVTAVVRDDDGAPQRADVLLQELDDAAWERLLTTVAREAGHLAALLDGEMPPHLVADADAADVGLLPVIGDLEAACTCDAWDHCPHTAALSYQVARLLDEDPFVLLLLRGRDTRTLLEQLGARGARQDAGPDAGAGAAGHAGGPDQGVDAREAFTFAAVLPPLPELPVPPAVPPVQAAPVQAAGEGAGSGPDPAALAFLVADAAARARRHAAQWTTPFGRCRSSRVRRGVDRGCHRAHHGWHGEWTRSLRRHGPRGLRRRAAAVDLDTYPAAAARGRGRAPGGGDRARRRIRRAVGERRDVVAAAGLTARAGPGRTGGRQETRLSGYRSSGAAGFSRLTRGWTVPSHSASVTEPCRPGEKSRSCPRPARPRKAGADS